ncbi:MAG TPA: SRPBCC domain-containing protein [Daejeonella sp.]|nr:SRPBCC domain-containing protein [Daejeonella sp.]
MENYDWTKFTKRIPIKASIPNIYRLISTCEGLESWFLRLAEFKMPDNTIRPDDSEIKAGDSYRWMWHGYPNDVAEQGRVVESNGLDTIRFTFAVECIVTIMAKPHNDVIVVEITQENIPTDEKSKINYFIGCGEGWDFYLANLKSILEGGIDLRNRDETLQGVLNS